MIPAIAAVAFGGAIGACLRTAITHLVEVTAGRRFPHALYVVNALGSFLLGFFLGAFDAAAHPFLVSGLCGALTTFSTFAHATVELIRAGRTGAALAHVGLNLGGSLVAVVMGLGLGGNF